MLSGINAGLAGMRAAEARFEARATNIVNWQSQNYRPLVPVQTTQGDGSPIVKVTRPEPTSPEEPGVDLAAEIVDMQNAKRSFQASALVVRTADRMTKTLLDMFA